jgi:hypothetical protein
MGTFIYGSPGITIDFDDRALTHIQVVIMAKLRRHESFAFSWANEPDKGSGRNSIWLDPSIPLLFRYFGSRPPEINRQWLNELQQSADSGTGLVFTPEPPRVAPVSDSSVSVRIFAPVRTSVPTKDRVRPAAV